MDVWKVLGDMKHKTKTMCKLCQDFYKKFPLKNKEHILFKSNNFVFKSAPTKCAFKNGIFNSDNWSCETMMALRELAEEGLRTKNEVIIQNFFSRDDLYSESIGAIEIPESDEDDIQQGWLVMSWYKDRGETGQAYVFWGDTKPEKLTLKTAEFVLERVNEIHNTKK